MSESLPRPKMSHNRLSEVYTKITRIKGIEYWLLAAITVLAALLRFYKLGEWSFWIDEIFSINRALRHYGNIDILVENIPPARNWIPISVILTAQVLKNLGVSEWSARLLPAIIGILTIPVLYFPIRKIFNGQVSLIALLLLAFNTWHIEWSQNARFYTTLMLFYSLALIFFYFGIEQDRPHYIIIFMVLLYLAASERFFALFIIPVVLFYLVLLRVLPFEKPKGLRFRNLAIILLPILMAGIIDVYSLIKYGTTRFFGDFYWFFQFPIDDPLRLFSFISFDIGVPLVIFSSLCGVYLILKRNRAGLLIFVGALIPIAILLVLNPFMFTKSRYVFITLPSWVILGAIGVREVYKEIKGRVRILALGILLMLLADSIGSNLLYYQVNNGNRHDWKGAFSIVKERRQIDDELVTTWPEWKGFYWDRDIVIWETIDTEFVLSSDNRFWFILDEEIIWGNTKMKSWLEANAQLIDILYLRRENNYYLRIYLYDPALRTSIINTPESKLLK